MTSPRKRRPVLLLIALGSLLAFYFIPVRIGGHDKLALTSALVRAAGGETVTLTTPVALSRDPAIILEKGSISIESSDKSAGLATLLKSLASGEASLVLDEAVVSIGGPRAPGSPPAASPEPAAGVPDSIVAALESFRFETLKVRRTMLRVDNGGDVTELGSVASNIKLAGRTGAIAEGVLSRNGQDVQFNIELKPSDAPKDTARSSIRARLMFPLASAEFEGRVARGPQLQIAATQSRVTVTDVAGMANWLGEEKLASAGFKTFSANGPFEWNGSSLEFQSGDIVIDGNAAVGSLSIEPAGERIGIDGTLDFAKLDLGTYLGADGGGAAPFGAVWLKAITGTSRGISFIQSIDADLRISANDIVIGSRRLGRGAAALAMKDGRLNANIAEIELSEGGSGEGVVAVDARGGTPRYKVSGEVRDLDAAWAGLTFFDSTLFDGKATLSGELAASGSNLAELLPTLDGRFAIAAADAGGMPLDLDAIMATANTVKAADPLAGAWRKFAVKGLNIRLQATNGLLTSETAELATERAQFKAAGTLDLRDQSLDVSLARSTPEGGANAGSRNSIRIRGELAKPAVSTDAGDDRSDEGGALNGPSEPVMITLD